MLMRSTFASSPQFRNTPIPEKRMTDPLPRPLAAVRNAQLPDGRVVDVSFASGVVSAITTAGTADLVGQTLDLRGCLLLPAPAEPHAHLDKARSFDAANPKL